MVLPDFKGAKYLDIADEGKERVQDGDLVFDKEVDRIFVASPDTIKLPSAKVTITKSNLPETVVWNPHAEKAAALVDLPDDGYKNFICIEPGAIVNPVQVLPNATWEASVVFAVDKDNAP